MKNSKLLIVFLSVLLVGACSKVIKQKDIEQANQYCKDKEGVFSISVISEHTERDITCKNGDSINSNSIMLSAH